MTLSLRHTNRNIDTEALHNANWAAIIAIAPDGTVAIDEDIVDSIAMLLDHQSLTTGELVSSYPRDEDLDPQFGTMPSYVGAFGPSLLPTMEQDYVRDRLSRAGADAVHLFNEAIRLGIQVTLKGKDNLAPAQIRAVNQPADEVMFNLTETNMVELLHDLRLERFIDKTSPGSFGQVDLDTFVAAVDTFGDYADRGPAAPHCKPRLEAFIASARRCDATHVLWF